MIETSYGLNQIQLAGIAQLEQVCNKFEGLSLKLNWTTLRSRPKNEVNDFLSYENGELVGHLALYVFNRQEAEVSAMTHPDYRRQGIFKRLLTEARVELKGRGVPSFLFICERNSGSGQQCMQTIQARYEFSEYRMVLQELGRPASTRPEVQLRPALPEDIPDLVRMDEGCFYVTPDETVRYLERDLADQQRQLWVAQLGSQKIGKIGVLKGATETYIYAFCLFPQYRGQGYGRTILSRIVAHLVESQYPNITLEVACDNEQALSLYQQCGFCIVATYDYFRLPVDLKL